MTVNNNDHCRIGSLEIILTGPDFIGYDHCRIGSLENNNNATSTVGIGSLPHRQLRNTTQKHGKRTG